MILSNTQMLAVDFETKVLSAITGFYKTLLNKKTFNIQALETNVIRIASQSIKQFRDAIADTIYDNFNVKDIKKLSAIPEIQTIFTNSEKEIINSISFASVYAVNYASNLVLQKEAQAISSLNELYNKGLKANPKYSLMGAIGFIDSEVEIKTNFLVENEKEPESNYIYIPKTHSACAVCARWQGETLIDDVYRNGTPDGITPLLSEAMEEGLFHPNCRDTFIRVSGKDDPEIKKLKETEKEPKELKAHTIEERYQAEQRQRQLAEQTRNWKRKKEDGLDELGKVATEKDRIKIQKQIELADERIKQKYAEANQLRKDDKLLRVNYRAFQTNYEYRSRQSWDFNSLRNQPYN